MIQLVSNYRLQFKPYRREFAAALRTSRGLWTHREGVLLRLENADGRTGFGEIAPLEGFSTETVVEACRLMEQWNGRYYGLEETIIPPGYPATEMGLWHAEQMIAGPDPGERTYSVTALLPAGKEARAELVKKREAGFRSFKWKVAVYPVENESVWLEELLGELPPGGTLRLDANGGLDAVTFCTWMERLDGVPQIEFFEQPLPANQLEVLREGVRSGKTPVALDESVSRMNTLAALTEAGWEGLLVIKPCIVGSPSRYLQWQARWDRDFIFSSGFETAIGMEQALRLMAGIKDGGRIRSLGFGVNDYFIEDGLSLHGTAPEITAGKIKTEHMEALWKQL